MRSTLAIIPAYVRSLDDLKVTERTIRSLDASTDAEILVVDDASPGNPDLISWLRASTEDVGGSYHRQDENGGFAKAVNVGLRRARKADMDALLVNADMEFSDNGWLDKMRANPADVVGGLLIYPNKLVQHAGVFFSIITRQFDHRFRMAPSTLSLVQEPCICPVTGALMLIKAETITKVGIFDENFQMGFEDVDYCHEVFKAGLKCAYDPSVVAIHHEGLFRKQDASGEIQKKWWASFNYLHEKHRGHGFADYVPTMIWDD